MGSSSLAWSASSNSRMMWRPRSDAMLARARTMAMSWSFETLSPNASRVATVVRGDMRSSVMRGPGLTPEVTFWSTRI